MGRIIDYLKPILVGNLLDPLRIARLPIDMHRHNGRRLRGDGRLNLIRIDIPSRRIDIHKHWFAVVPPDGMGRGNKTIWCGDHLAGDSKRLQSREQRQRSIRKQTDIRYLKILAQCCFQLPMERPVIGNPLAIPDYLEHLIELLQIRKKGRCNGYYTLVNHLTQCP